MRVSRYYNPLLIFFALLLGEALSGFLFKRTIPKITRVIFTGGGAKGALYPGAYRALDEAGLLNTITHVSGSSIGAVAAGFLSVGISSDEFYQAMLNTSYKELFGPRIGFLAPKKPGFFPISRTGLPFETWVRQHLTSTAHRFLSDKYFFTRISLYQLKAKLSKNLQADFTFSDLDLLNKHFPHVFKKLTVVATHYPEGNPAIFNAISSPDVDIAKAIRASGSFPILLIPTSIDGSLFIDGGLTDNFPDSFDWIGNENKLWNKQKDKTLVFAFKDDQNTRNGPLFRALHGSGREENNQVLFRPSLFESFKLDRLLKWCLGLRSKEKLTTKIEHDYQRIKQHYPLRTVALSSGTLSATHFAKGQKLSRVMSALGYVDTLQFIIHHDLCHEEAAYEGKIKSLLAYFNLIYTALMTGAHQNVTNDELGCTVTRYINSPPPTHKIWSQPQSYQSMLHFIQEQTQMKPQSLASFALSRAVEYSQKTINSTQLSREIEQEAQAIISPTPFTNLLCFFNKKSTHFKPNVEQINHNVALLDSIPKH